MKQAPIRIIIDEVEFLHLCQRQAIKVPCRRHRDPHQGRGWRDRSRHGGRHREAMKGPRIDTPEARELLSTYRRRRR
jgi:hypothetical protein